MSAKFKQLAFRLSVIIAAVLFSADALAATQSVTASISFAAPLSLTKVSDISFGIVKALTKSNYTISTDGTVTATGSGQWLAGTPSAASINIAGTTTGTLNISVGGYTAQNGVTPSNATCSYNGGASGSCKIKTAAAPGTGKTLLVGVEAKVNGKQAAGSTATPSFTITVAYN